MLDRGQSPSDTRRTCAPVNNFDRDHHQIDLQVQGVPVDDLGRGQVAHDAHGSPAPSFSYLLLCADSLDDAERMRIALENRLRALEAGKDHAEPGPSLAKARPYAHWHGQLEILIAFEHRAALELKRALRATPYADFQQRTLGLGEKQFARLLAAIGDPYWNAAEGRPRRGPAELWAYCGYAPAQKRRKGVKSNWNATAKMRAFLCAESCMKQRTSPYRDVYDKARMDWASRETSDGHKHNHALRIVAKRILRDLWGEGRGLAIRPTGPVFDSPGASTSSAGARVEATTKCRTPQPDLAGAAA